jgi:hypothetical protein
MSGASNDERIQKFLEKRSIFEQLARIKYLNWPIDEPESVLVKTMDITKLLEEMK